MGAKGKILAELGDTAYRWVTSLAKKLEKPADEVAYEMGSKLTNLEIEAPEAFRTYDPKRLYEVLVEANRGQSDIALMNPSRFEELAAQINMDDPYIADMVYAKVDEYMNDLSQGTALGDVPYLEYDSPIDQMAQIIAHDGRHRSRAQANTGALESLVRLVPKNEQTELISKMNPDAKAFSEISPMQMQGKGGKEVGSVRDLFKTLSVAGVPLGALGGLPDEQN